VRYDEGVALTAAGWEFPPDLLKLRVDFDRAEAKVSRLAAALPSGAEVYAAYMARKTDPDQHQETEEQAQLSKDLAAARAGVHEALANLLDHSWWKASVGDKRNVEDVDRRKAANALRDIAAQATG
jgi:hypothetical protein